MSTVSCDVDPDETKDLRDLIAEVVQDPDQWLDTENDMLGGRKPKDLLNTPQVQQVRDLARAIIGSCAINEAPLMQPALALCVG